MVKLEKMGEEEFREYLEAAIRNYAGEKVRAGTWDEADSIRLSRETYSRLLPEGADTPDQYLFCVVDESTGKRVGMVWFGVNLTSEEREGAFIWDILIYPEYRGKGFGKGTMLALEEKVREAGERKITLHVFGHNSIATNLYKQVGYEVTDLIMSKSLS